MTNRPRSIRPPIIPEVERAGGIIGGVDEERRHDETEKHTEVEQEIADDDMVCHACDSEDVFVPVLTSPMRPSLADVEKHNATHLP